MSTESDPLLLQALGLALTGDPGSIDPERARQTRTARRQAELPWPMPVDPSLLARIGYARWAAVLQQAVTELGAASMPTRQPGTLSADERRLLQDRPPHW